MTGFEKFTRSTRSGRWRHDHPVISIYRNQQAALSRHVYEALGQPLHVVLLHDRATRRIAFQPTDDADNSYPARQNRSKRGVYPILITIAAFERWAGIDEERAVGTYDAVIEDGRAVITLPESAYCNEFERRS
jgi:hypothetical protein